MKWRMRDRRAPARPRSAPLSRTQVRWLGALLVAAQLPQTPHIPLWVACVGLGLVGLRLAVAGRASNEGHTLAPRAASWLLVLLAIAAAVAIRQSFGYFVGRDPSVSFLFVLVGIKFLETRTERDGTLLVCLACFLVITPFFYNQSLLATAAALPATLLVGAALQALARPPGPAPAFASWRAPARTTLVMMLQGLPLAAMLFVLFPRISGPLWGLPADHAAKTGLSDQMSPGLISELSLSDAVAFRVDFYGPVPPSWQRYWRGPVLSVFDGRTWSMGLRRGGGSLARGGAGTAVTYSVTLEPHWRPWLFALDLPSSLPQIAQDSDTLIHEKADAILMRDQQLFARQPITRQIRYLQTSVLADSYPVAGGQRLAFEVWENTRLPNGAPSNPRTLAFAHELRQEHPDDAGYIRAVLEYFRREPFHYTLAPPLLGANPVDAFLFEARRGFCEHYASAFAVLLRAAGIPARVVTGYQGGEMNPNGDYMIVRQSDAHAWTEALVDGRWRRFDPTAAVAPSRIQAGLGAALPAGEPVPLLARVESSFLKELQLSWDAINYGWRRHVIGFNYERQRSMWQHLNLGEYAPWQVAAAVALVAAMWSAMLLAWFAWRGRRQDRVRALWDRLGERLARAGLPRAPHEGPLAYAGRAARRWPDLASAFCTIGESYAALRYGPASENARAERERASVLRRLEHAIAVLPSPARLRSSPRIA